MSAALFGANILTLGEASFVNERRRHMPRVHIDCREFPSEMNCTVALVADTQEELLEAAVQHAVAVHKHKDTPEFRAELRKIFKQGNPRP